MQKLRLHRKARKTSRIFCNSSSTCNLQKATEFRHRTMFKMTERFHAIFIRVPFQFKWPKMVTTIEVLNKL